MVLTTCYSLALLHDKHESISNEQTTINERKRETFLFRDRSRPFRRHPVVRGLQRNDPGGSFGLPGTQHGTPEEEEEGGSIVMPMEEAACPEGRRRRLLAMVVARSSWRRKHSQRWWGTHASREREEGEGGDIIHKAQE